MRFIWNDKHYCLCKVFYCVVDPLGLLNSAPPSKNKVSAISDYMQITYFHLGRFLKKLTDDQYSSITKGIIYYNIKHMLIQPFSMEVDWPANWCLMEVSVFYICIHCIYTWHNRMTLQWVNCLWQPELCYSIKCYSKCCTSLYLNSMKIDLVIYPTSVSDQFELELYDCHVNWPCQVWTYMYTE